MENLSEYKDPLSYTRGRLLIARQRLLPAAAAEPIHSGDNRPQSLPSNRRNVSDSTQFRHENVNSISPYRHTGYSKTHKMPGVMPRRTTVSIVIDCRGGDRRRQRKYPRS